MMKSSLTLVFGDREIEIALPASEPAWTREAARTWLDEQFLANECEPLRASGKVLTADKLYAIADAVGEHGFVADPAYQQAFAQAALAALQRPNARIDVDGRSLSH